MKLALHLARHHEDLEQYPPLGLGYIASYLRKHLSDVEVVMCPDLDSVVRERPDILGVSCVSHNYGRAIGMACAVRKVLGIPVFVGGVHISTLPESLHPCFLFGIVGEGELTILEIMKRMSSGAEPTCEELGDVAGLVLHGEGGIRLTGDRAMIEPLDLLPFPDRDFLGYVGESAHLMASRGCPYSCAFCSSSAHWGKYRAFSADYVIRELEHLMERYGTREVHFYDDLFIADKKRLSRFRDDKKEG